MLEAPVDALTLSTTIPVVPLGSSMGPLLTAEAVGPLVMSKDRMQPLASPLVHCVPTDTKRKSVPSGSDTLVMLGLKNSAKGEQGLLFPAESATFWTGPVPPGVVFMVEPVKPVDHNAAIPLPVVASEPHT